MPSRLLDMRDCASSEFSQLYDHISRLSSGLQPVWFRPLFRIRPIRRKLEFDHWSRRWEYPWAVLSADLQAGMRVLDAGSGGSPFPVYLAISGCECYATDPTLDQGQPKRRWLRRLLSSLRIAVVDSLPPAARLPVKYSADRIQELSFPDEFFDRVFCLSVMEHIPGSDWPLCMNELARVVRPEGRLMLSLDMSTPDANARIYQYLIEACPLDLIGSVDYPVPIPAEDKQLRHPGHTYETIGLLWQKP